MRPRRFLFLSLALVSVCLVGVLVYNLPPVHERLAWRAAGLRSRVYYALNPPQEVVFVPQEQQALIEAIVQATLTALLTPSASSSPPATQTQPVLTTTPEPTATPTPQPSPLPNQVMLDGLRHDYQRMNNCGPTTLAILLSFWGWHGDQYITREYLRPNHDRIDDKNVMPAEMLAFVESQTGLRLLLRYGGDVETLKRLVAAGFPVMVEKGFEPPDEDWMGHYEVVNGYDDANSRFITQDSYIMPDFPVPYTDLSERWWRDFNYVYIAAYPPEREGELLALLGPDADIATNLQRALDKAYAEAQALSGRDLFFAWFNVGNAQSALGMYAESAQAFDQAFAVYASLPEDERPWRTLWYRVEPYEAYYRTGRFQDVIRLADTTLSFAGGPILEETLYWRGMAREALGNASGAIADWQKAARVNPTSTNAALELQRLGASVP